MVDYQKPCGLSRFPTNSALFLAAVVESVLVSLWDFLARHSVLVGTAFIGSAIFYSGFAIARALTALTSEVRKLNTSELDCELDDGFPGIRESLGRLSKTVELLHDFLHTIK